MVVSDGSVAAGRRVSDVTLPDGSLIISLLRDGRGYVPKGDTVVQAGDEVLVVLDPGLEADITQLFVTPNGRR
jgi:trk system potassium uptake protein TrkA